MSLLIAVVLEGCGWLFPVNIIPTSFCSVQNCNFRS